MGLLCLPLWPQEAIRSPLEFSARESRNFGSSKHTITVEKLGNRNRNLLLPFTSSVIFSKALHYSVSVSSAVEIICSSYEITDKQVLSKLTVKHQICVRYCHSFVRLLSLRAHLLEVWSLSPFFHISSPGDPPI